jgi:hypothetical protein
MSPRYLNCGASVSNRRVKTKAELKALMRENPSQVTFDATSMFDRDGSFKGDAIPAGVTLSVVGPDPRTPDMVSSIMHGRVGL